MGCRFFQIRQQRKGWKRLYLRLTFQKFEHYFTSMEPDILQHFQEIKDIIRQGQGQALQAVNAELIRVNWQVGAYLSTRLTTAAYGDRIVNQLAQWLQTEEPGLKGFDKRTLYRMKQFFETWHSLDQELLPVVAREYYVLKNNKI